MTQVKVVMNGLIIQITHDESIKSEQNSSAIDAIDVLLSKTDYK